MGIEDEKVIRDLDHAREVLRESVNVKWGEKIKHSEPQVIVACAVVVHELAEQVDKLTDAMAALEAVVAEVTP